MVQTIDQPLIYTDSLLNAPRRQALIVVPSLGACRIIRRTHAAVACGAESRQIDDRKTGPCCTAPSARRHEHEGNNGRPASVPCPSLRARERELIRVTVPRRGSLCICTTKLCCMHHCCYTSSRVQSSRGVSVGPIRSNATPTENSYEKDLRADVCLSSANHDGSNRQKKRVVGQRFEEKKTSSFITEPRELLVKPGDHAPTSEVASNHAR
jgi:hypothetical protein